MLYIVNLSSFYWFGKNKEFSLDIPVKCRDNKKVQALLFIFKGLKKHVTFTVSKRICELHVTDDDKRNDHRSVFTFPIRRMKKDVRKSKNICEFISLNDEFFSQMMFVDPFTVDFLYIMRRMSHSSNHTRSSRPLIRACLYIWNKITGHGLEMDLNAYFNLPSQIQKYHMSPNMIRKYHSKILLVCNSRNKFQGLVKIDVRRHGATYCSAKSIKIVQNKYVNIFWLITQLHKEDSPKTHVAGSKLIYDSPAARFFDHV